MSTTLVSRPTEDAPDGPGSDGSATRGWLVGRLGGLPGFLLRLWGSIRPDAARLRRHWLLVLLLAAGTALRVLALIAYQPALLYIDSYRYLDNLQALDPNGLDPIGYDLLLWPMLAAGGLRTVTIVQHLAGLGLGIASYALAMRLGARRWLAALAAAPVLLDAYQVQIEQNIMSDLWLEVLILAVVWVLVGRGAPTARRAATAGVLLGAAFMVRTIALPLVLPVVGFVILAWGEWRSRAGWKRIGVRAGALLGALAAVLFGYAAYFHACSGQWQLTATSGSVLYGRTAEVADCAKLKLPPELAQICPTEPLDGRVGVDYYSHLDTTGAWPAYVPPGSTAAKLEQRFGLAVLRQQPVDVVESILADFAKGFAWGKTSAPTDVPVDRWQFQTSYPIFIDGGEPVLDRYTMTFSDMLPTVHPGVAGVLRAYQLHGGYTHGPLLALGGLLGALGGFGLRVRRSCAAHAGASAAAASVASTRAAAMLTTTMAGAILLGSAVFEFSWRYQLPGLVLLPLGGVLGLTALLGPQRREVLGAAKKRRRRLAAFPDDVDSAAIAEFTQRHGEPDFAPVLVVIAAYNEEGGIGGVLDKLPKSCCDLDVDVLVVADGCADDTVGRALAGGAYVCAAPANRGQGAALRLGYQLAARGGAQYVITTDADGQYDNAEMPLLLRPLLAGEADFVTGSRRLGVEDTDDRVRSVGVRVFATLASVLTFRKITDTSFGFRAMRTELACSVRLRQPQYQASELLLGALAGGARLLEQPMTMRTRTAGSSKKGSNLAYGCNYARVMTWTWLREFVLARLAWLAPRRAKPAAWRQPCATPTTGPTTRT